MFEEIYKYCDKLPIGYEVSNYGNVKNIKTGRILKPCLNSGRSAVLNIRKKCFSVTRLVWETFCDPANKHKRCYHIDGNHMNNRFDNLNNLGKLPEIVSNIISRLKFSRRYKLWYLVDQSNLSYKRIYFKSEKQAIDYLKKHKPKPKPKKIHLNTAINVTKNSWVNLSTIFH